MRIRQIELIGFKSFRDLTRLSFVHGVNAVVGPNGCGKSNIVDAIRWALGEQSVKHLRAREMEDVIFCGNVNSAPLNFAEVSLTFEQAGDDDLLLEGEAEGLAAQVARLPEFTVTRRIFRSGDSQYFINQAPVRLRDITELFLGSGVGPKAYAVIEQFRVSDIIKAKPEELRLFIEEAAGTTRFRSRKLAAERKLERTGENLSRVQDVMREIERQLATLRRQARRAEEYRALDAELRATEIGVAAARWRALSAERRVIEAELAEARGLLAGFEREAEAAERGRAAAAAKEQAAACDIERAFGAVAEASAAVVRGTERQSSLRDGLASLGSRIERARTEVAGLDDGLLASEAALHGARARRVQASARESAEASGLERAELEVEALAPACDTARAEHAVAVAALGEARARVATAAATRAEHASRVEALRHEAGRATARTADRAREVSRTEGGLQEAVARLEEARRTHDLLDTTRRGAAAELHRREGALRRVEETLGAVREALLHVRGRLEGLQERERSLDGYAEGLAAAMACAPARRELVVEGLSIPADLEPAVAAVLGDTLRGAIVGTPEEGAAIAEDLRRSDAGRVALVPIASRQPVSVRGPLPGGTALLAPLIGASPGRERVRAALFDRVALADDLATAVAAWRASSDEMAWVTRAGDVVDCHGVVTGGRPPAGADLLRRRREVSELSAQIAEDEIRQAALEVHLAQLREECGDLGERLRRIDGETHEAALALVSADHGLEVARRELAAADQRRREAQAEGEEAERELSVAEVALASAEVRAEEAATGAAAAEAHVREMEGELERRRAALDESRSRRDAAREMLAAAREAVVHASAEVARIEHARTALEGRRGGLAIEIESLVRERQAAEGAVAALEVELASGRRDLTERETAVERARESARHAQLELREHEARLARARRAQDAARERCQGFAVRLAERGAQIEALLGYALERYAVDAAQADVPDAFDEAEAVARIAQLRERIARLGDVNVAAIADAKELEERYAFLEAQRTDLEASIADVRRTIAELSRTTRARFRETFEQANLRFEEFFTEMFRGGRAALRMTEPGNLLETGVEMEVQPPGKTLRGMDALSGGEKALTAISLLLALFSLRATPFCVLDEVDAPLDEANLARFNAMLQRMSERTQFIVITHKQLTMEHASVLYGVTMADPGVSQLVSVELHGRDERRREKDELALAASA